MEDFQQITLSANATDIPVDFFGLVSCFLFHSFHLFFCIYNVKALYRTGYYMYSPYSTVFKGLEMFVVFKQYFVSHDVRKK